MRFKDWLQNEIQLNLSPTPTTTGGMTPVATSTQTAQATQGLAQQTMAKFGTNLVQDLGAAPNPVKAGKVAVNYAQRTMGKAPLLPEKTPTNPLAVGAQVYKQATGTDLKTMGKR